MENNLTEQNPFDFFDKIFYINLDSRPERDLKMQELFKKHKINAERFSAIQLSNEENEILKQEGCLFKSDERPDYSRFAKSCALSHLNIILRAKLMDYENVLIFEDDVFFKEDIMNELQKSIKDLELQPKWDMFYIGCNPFAYENVTENLALSLGAYSAHAYAVNRNFYDTVLKMPFKVLPIIDVYYLNLATNPLNKIFMCSKNLACQAPSYSTIEQMQVDYLPIIEERYKRNIIQK
jgi:GR25 family glycosyltransferase involved in LPS biosynthesis